MEFPFSFEQIQVTNWAYLSSLLMLALFFKFNRFWSVRNFDLILIVLLAPGVLMVMHGSERDRLQRQDESPLVQPQTTDTAAFLSPDGTEATTVVGLERTKDSLNGKLTGGQRMILFGYIWMFSIGALFLLRLLLDPLLVRKPLLDPNLSVGGLVFLACSLLAFSFANVVQSQAMDVSGAKSALKLVQREAAGEADTVQLRQHGPGYALFYLLPVMPTFSSGTDMLESDPDESENMVKYVAAAKTLALVGQLAIMFALIFIGNFHFHNFLVGVGMATIYLMLPYTAVYAGHVPHVLPAALLIWAVACYRQPGIAGLFIGLAIGVFYYPLFLLPLWISFYWEKGFKHFLLGVLISVGCSIGSLVFVSLNTADFFNRLIGIFGFWWPRLDGLGGVWGLGWDPWFRLPIVVAFVALCVSFAFWPIRKNVGTLIAYSAAVMVAVQFWHGFGGGLYVAWYLPMALAAIFRPNLNDRDATTDLNDGVLGIRRKRNAKNKEEVLALGED
jgi:hypothetical protein